jgi:hypothetical protein
MTGGVHLSSAAQGGGSCGGGCGPSWPKGQAAAELSGLARVGPQRPAAATGLACVPQAEEKKGRRRTSNRWAASKVRARKDGGLRGKRKGFTNFEKGVLG